MEIKPEQTIISQKLSLPSWQRYVYYVVLGVFVFAEAVSAFIFVPKLLSNNSLNQSKVSDLTVETKELDSALQVLESLDRAKVQNDLVETAQALPTEKKVSGIVSSLTSLASSSGIIVSQLELTPCNLSTRSGTIKVKTRVSDCQDVVLENGVKGVHLSMTVLADDAHLLDFANHLYNVSPMLGVNTFEYSFSAKGQTASLTLLLYFQPSLVDVNDLSKISAITDSEIKVVNSLSTQEVILP